MGHPHPDLPPSRHTLRSARLPTFGLVAVALSLVSAGAQANPESGLCHGPRIVMSETVSERWRNAVENARVLLGQANNVDRCAELVLEPVGGDLLVRVSLADGRAGVRNLTNPSLLAPTLLAVLSLPPVKSPAEQTSAPLPQDRPAPENRVNGTASVSDPHLELGLGAMARVAGGPLYGGLGLSAFAQLSLHRWLVGVSARWDASDVLLLDAPPSGFNMQTLALGVQVGVRSSFRGFALDALVGPEARIENQEAFGEQPATDGIGGGASDFRLDAALRLTTPAKGSLRFFSEADANASPARVTKPRRLDGGLPTLPSWSTGIALGVLWSPS